MTDFIKRFTANTQGRDFIVGDIHGSFSKLEHALEKIRFDAAHDRLFSVGDMVDRGPESPRVLDFLSQEWFHAVRGNHEAMCLDMAFGKYPASHHVKNGGAWFASLSEAERVPYVDAFSNLPRVIEIEHSHGPIGIVHADCPMPSWPDFCARLPDDPEIQYQSMWNRNRVEEFITDGVSDVRAVVVGHMPLSAPVILGNVYHIDTTAVSSRGHFTFLELGETLQLHEPGRLRPESVFPSPLPGK